MLRGYVNTYYHNVFTLCLEKKLLTLPYKVMDQRSKRSLILKYKKKKKLYLFSFRSVEPRTYIFFVVCTHHAKLKVKLSDIKRAIDDFKW